ncbi:hypothetical protein ACLUEY_01185 [Vreelandella aquamarina]
MSTIAHIPAPTLTQAHRDAIAHIQDLAISVSLQGVYAIDVEYYGNVHLLSVSVLSVSNIAKGDFKADTSMRIDLPGSPRHTPPASFNALEKLQDAARELENLLTPPNGDDAA